MPETSCLSGFRFSRSISRLPLLWKNRLLLVLCRASFLIGPFTLAAGPALPAPLPSPVGHWSFDDGVGVTATDLSGNGNTGVLVNEPTWTTGRLGSALSFDGVNDYVEVAHSDSLNLRTELTVSTWVYNQGIYDPLLQNSEYHIIAAKGWAGDAGGSWTLAWDKKTNALLFFVRKSSDNGYKSVSVE